MKKRNATDSSNGYSYEKVIIHIESLRNYNKKFEIFPEEGEDFKLIVDDYVIFCQVKHKNNESFNKKNGAFIKHLNDKNFDKNDKYIFKIFCLSFNEKQLDFFDKKNYEQLFKITKNKLINYDKKEVLKLLNKTKIIVEKDFPELFEEANIIISEIIGSDNKDLCNVISMILLHYVTYDVCVIKGSVYTDENMKSIINKYKNLNMEKVKKIKFSLYKTKEIINFYNECIDK